MAGEFKQFSFNAFGEFCNCGSSAFESVRNEEELVVIGEIEVSVLKCTCGLGIF